MEARTRRVHLEPLCDMNKFLHASLQSPGLSPSTRTRQPGVHGVPPAATRFIPGGGELAFTKGKKCFPCSLQHVRLKGERQQNTLFIKSCSSLGKRDMLRVFGILPPGDILTALFLTCRGLRLWCTLPCAHDGVGASVETCAPFLRTLACLQSPQWLFAVVKRAACGRSV